MARPSLLIKRDVLPVSLDAHGNSFLGGLPKLPPHFDWPMVIVGGEAAGLWFAGQFDMRDIPDPSRYGLPEKGRHFFFFQDCWQNEGVVEGYNPAAVLYDPDENADHPPRKPPSLMVPPNEGFNSPPAMVSEADELSKRSFRFDVEFIPFTSYPDFEFSLEVFENLPAFRQLADTDVQALVEELIHHDGLAGWGNTEIDRRRWLKAWGPATMWAVICSHLFGDIRDRLVSAAYEQARAPDPHALPTEFLPEPAWEEMAFCWLFIDVMARKLITDRSYCLKAIDRFRTEDASDWVQLANHNNRDLFCALPEAEKQSFMKWMQELDFYKYRATEVLRFCIAKASEAGRLDAVPGGLVSYICENLYHSTARHQMLGWGWSDHAVIGPDELAEKVILLKLSNEDDLLGGCSQLSGGEGVFHFWMEPEALSQKHFAKIHCTC